MLHPQSSQLLKTHTLSGTKLLEQRTEAIDKSTAFSQRITGFRINLDRETDGISKQILISARSIPGVHTEKPGLEGKL